MKINRIKKEKDFVILSTIAVKDEKISWAAKGLHTFIMQLPDDWDLNVEGLKSFSTTGRDGTASIIIELINAGYILRSKKCDEKGRFTGYEYDVYETPVENPMKIQRKKNTSKKGISENGKTVNGKAVNGVTENGKTVTIKYEDNTSVLSNEELTNKSLSDFDKSHPPTLFEGQKNNLPLNTPKEEKEKKVAPKKEKEEVVQLDSEAQELMQQVKQGKEIPTPETIAGTPTPKGVNPGLFLKLREFGVFRQQRAKSKRMTTRAWSDMIKALQKASTAHPPQDIALLIDYAISKQYDSPFFAGYQDLITKLKTNNHVATDHNHQPTTNGNAKNTSERIKDAFGEIHNDILTKYGLTH